MKKIILFCLVFIPFITWSQVIDDFEDGDISDWTQSAAGRWAASDIDPINGNYSLHHIFDNPSGDRDQISIPLSGVNISAGTVTWKFQLKYAYSPSGSNNWACFLFADANAAQMHPSGTANGYAFGVNYSGTDDTLKIWKITSGGGSEILNTHINWEDDFGTGVYGFQVTRTDAGEWSVYADYDGGFNNLVQIGPTVTNTDHTIADYFGFYYEYSSAQDQKLWVDDVSVLGASGNDNDSEVLQGPDTEPATISSLENSPDGVQVFDVQFSDLGTSDNLPTIIDNIQFTQGDNNNISDWTDAIAGAKLFGDDLPAGIEGIVNSDNIIFSDDDFISIDNNSTENYQLNIWLKTDLSEITDNDNFEFKLDYSNILCDYNGSAFGSGVIESGDNKNAIDIEASKLSFTSVPTVVGVNQDFLLSVAATDVNENIDIDNTNSLTLSVNDGTGNLTSATGLTQNLTSGEFTWNDLRYDVIEDFNIKASSSGLTEEISPYISCSEYIYFLNDDFEDGDIYGWNESTTGRWAASDMNPINGIFSLHHVFDASESGADIISHQLSGFDVTSDSSVWQFQIKYDNADPSGSNNWSVFIMADANYEQMYNGGAINGYLIGVNFDGTDDIIKLWKITDGTVSEVINTGLDWNGFDENLPKSFVVSRSASGFWKIMIDQDGGFDNLVTYGTATDATHTTATNFGILYNYTSSMDQLLWIDDVYVGPPIPDTESPNLDSISVISPYDIKLIFNEEMNIATAQDVSNYTVNNSVGNPLSATVNSSDKRIVNLNFAASFEDSINYELLIENLQDLSGNIIDDTIVNFNWKNIDIQSLRFISTTKIDVKFTKFVDSASVENIANYSVDNSIGQPVSAVFDSIERDIVSLTFADPFEYEQTYILSVENIQDLFGNSITPTDYEFVFYMVRRNDIVINELMIDVNPEPVALPTNEYIEIYNVSDYDIDISDWILKIGDNSDLVFPQATLKSNDFAIICADEAQNLFEPYGQVFPILNETYLTSTTGKKIILRNTDNEIIEEITYDPDTWYGNPDKDDGGWSMERIDPDNVCNQNNNWLASENYTGGTPGMINSVDGNNPDEQSPDIEKFDVITSRDIIIDFSETVDTLQAESLINYILNSSVTPLSANINTDDNSIVNLHFLENFQFGDNDLTISNISDYCGNNMSDTNISFNYELINVTDIEPKSSTQLIIYFSEPAKKTSAENILNYSVDEGIGNPIVAVRDENDSSVVHLLFENEFNQNQEYTLSINGISDIYDNIMQNQQLVFTYHIPQAFDIVINEIMVDINPEPLGLPDVQYIELFNTSNYDLWLSNWLFIAENQSERVFPTVKIPSNDFLILCNENDEKLLTEYGKTVPILGYSDLTQSGKELEIFDNRYNLIYHVRYSDSWYNNDDKDNGGWSLEKIDPFNFCETSFNWSASEDVSGGTPGRENSVYQTNPDTTKPQFLNVIVKTSNKLIVEFSKNISLQTGLDTANYYVENFGYPQTVSFQDTSYSTVNLYFDKQFTDEQTYNLNLSNIYDDCGNSIEQTNTEFTYYLIHPEYIWVLNQNQIQIKFSEEVDNTTALEKDNYIVNNQIGAPNYVVKGAEDPSLVFLQFAQFFEDGVTNSIEISNIKDVNDNTMEATTLEFIFYNAKPNDIVINELLFNPHTGGADFVELYNRSEYDINLLNLVIAKRDDDNQISSPYKIFDNNLMFEPQTYIVITEDSADVQNNYQYGGKFIQLNNMPSFPDDEGTVLVYDHRDSVIDEFSYNEDMHFDLISDNEGVSLERIDYNQPTQDTANWHSAAESAGFATPGLVNSQYKDIQQSENDGNVFLEPQVISPDNDGYNDQLYINYEFNEGGFVADVLIYNKNGRLIRTLAKDELLSVNGFWIWDGLDEQQRKVKVGIYAVIVKVFDLDGNVTLYKKAAVVSGKQ